MTPEEVAEYQQNAIDEAADSVEDRIEHINGPWGAGLLDGEHLNEHGNDRLQAYLEGYADALVYAEHQVDGIDNVAKHLREGPVEAWFWQADNGEWRVTVATDDQELTYRAGHIAEGRDSRPLEAATEFVLKPAGRRGDDD